MITFTENKNSNINNNNNNNNINNNNYNNNNKLFKNILILIFLLCFLNLIILKKINFNFDQKNNNNNPIKKYNNHQNHQNDLNDIKLEDIDNNNNLHDIEIEILNNNNNNNKMTEPTTTTTNKRIYWPRVFKQINDNNNDDDSHDNDHGSSSSSSNEIELIEWNKCVLSMMGIDSTNKSIGYSYIKLDKENGRLILSPTKSQNEEEEDDDDDDTDIDNDDINIFKKKVIIAHAKSCPFHELELSNSIIHKDLQIEKLYPPIKVGVSVLVEDRFNRVLLTKRSDSLRIFPGIWVLPGGHMEIGESLFETGLRELNEEVGIDETMLDLESLNVIGIFESSYPNLLPVDKLPIDHHIVVFLYLKLKENKTITPKLQESEVQLAAWTPKSLLIELLEGTHTEFDLIDKQQQQHQQHTTITTNTVNNNNNKEIELIYTSTSDSDHQQQQQHITNDKIKQKFFKGTDNIATGTIYILKQFLREQQQQQQQQ